LTPEEYLAVPYVLVVESVQGPGGEWLRRAEYPELPGCMGIAYSPLDALDKLEEARVRIVLDRLERGEPIPVPRPPLHITAASNVERLGFARWLVEQRRIGEDHS
jgi:predicted RNase H-like HicB family nuclease